MVGLFSGVWVIVFAVEFGGFDVLFACGRMGSCYCVIVLLLMCCLFDGLPWWFSCLWCGVWIDYLCWLLVLWVYCERCCVFG